MCFVWPENCFNDCELINFCIWFRSYGRRLILMAIFINFNLRKLVLIFFHSQFISIDVFIWNHSILMRNSVKAGGHLRLVHRRNMQMNIQQKLRFLLNLVFTTYRTAYPRLNNVCLQKEKKKEMRELVEEIVQRKPKIKFQWKTILPFPEDIPLKSFASCLFPSLKYCS